jgi:hypothetical protein
MPESAWPLRSAGFLLIVCVDFQKHYKSFCFIDDFLEEMVDSQLEVFYIA